MLYYAHNYRRASTVMNTIWNAIGLAIICIIIGYFLSQVWVPFGLLGLIGAIAIICVYLFKRNRRIQ